MTKTSMTVLALACAFALSACGKQEEHPAAAAHASSSAGLPKGNASNWTAGFLPGPYQAVYYATKAFVTSFSQAIDQELRKDGITSTALCPGLVQTEFVASADLAGTGLANQKGATASSVAKCGYDAMMKGEVSAAYPEIRTLVFDKSLRQVFTAAETAAKPDKAKTLAAAAALRTSAAPVRPAAG